ncbi:hypothetical protein GCM10009687_63310 [Asanoa iriomotensis]|uniref:Uncharacterized protein n=1 Tax=Asanoa iriomotensis TaxID=234613 RepID=A0ABQ4C4C0_9ACTN|nr:hypothetical protein Air01nite_37230 [Asanoa iriomotensis]
MILVHRPSRPDWRCRVDGGQWPCPGARVELAARFTEDGAALAVFLVEHLFTASEDLFGTADGKPRLLADRFLFWAGCPTTTERALNVGPTVPETAPMVSACGGIDRFQPRDGGDR